VADISSGAAQQWPPRRLVLMRHAAAEFAGDSDHERPLSMAGRKQAQAVGQELLANQELPQLVLCSSALRTRTTKDLLLAQWGEAGADISVEVREDFYEARPRQILEVLKEAEASLTSVLVIGHEPTMSMLAALLAHADSDAAAVQTAQVGFVTAGRGVLDVECAWSDLEPRGGYLRAVQPPPQD